MARPIAIYVHWPFCRSKCPYCDFNSHVRATIDETAWRDALLADLHYEARLTPHRTATSLFFGGGTPSLMSPETAHAIIRATRDLWPHDGARADDPAGDSISDMEITLEVNPTSAEAARLADFAAAGVNRISLGVQALDDAALAFLGREHDAAGALAALDMARACVNRVSFDLIYGRPDQTLADWREELARALALGCDHLSLYQLTIEPGTRFATQAAQGKLVLPDDDILADMFALTQDETARAGLPAYEISNHARPGAASRHNLAYWSYDDYVGVGPGAHGRRGGVATQRWRLPETWLKKIQAQGHGIEQDESLCPATRAREALVMGLRLCDGIDPALFSARTGLMLDDALDGAELARLIDQGLIQHNSQRLAVTPAGRPVLNAIQARLIL